MKFDRAGSCTTPHRFRPRALSTACLPCPQLKEAILTDDESPHSGLPGREGTEEMQDIISSCIPLLHELSRRKASADGKQVHFILTESGALPDVHFGNMLVNLYSKCGCITDARHVFDNMLIRDEFTWTIMMAAYANRVHAQESLKLYHQMLLEGHKLDRVTCLTVLKSCSALESYYEGKKIHSLILINGIVVNITMGNTLMDMYAKCSSIGEAWRVFDTMANRDVVSWNIMISGCASLGHIDDAFSFFRSMAREGFAPDEVTYLNILKACNRIEQGNKIQDLIRRNEGKLSNFVGNSLMDLYIKCGSMVHAQGVFDEMIERDTLTWTMMIAGYAKHECPKYSVFLFSQIVQEGLLPNEITFVSVLSACLGLQEGKQIHVRYIGCGFPQNLVVDNALLDMYAKFGSLQNAQKHFDEMSCQDIISWNTLISGYANCGYAEFALDIFSNLDCHLQPDAATYLSTVKACAGLGLVEHCFLIHAHITESNIDVDVFMETTLLDMYGKCGNIDDARCLFDGMKKHDVIAWNTIIAAHVLCGHNKETFQLFRQMESEGIREDAGTLLNLLKACINLGCLEGGKHLHALAIEDGFESNVILFVSFIDLYAKVGSADDAFNMLNTMTTDDIVAWNAMIIGCAENDHCHRALSLFKRMSQRNLHGDTFTFVGVLKACASLADIEKGKDIHTDIGKRGLENDVYIASTLVDMYSKCGSVQEANMVFIKMSSHDLVTWNAMIAGYALHALAQEAVRMYYNMTAENVMADEITLISVLSACSHAGDLIEGCLQFKSITNTTTFSPTFDHYVCMVDLFGRAGLLREALNFIENIPIQPSTVLWTVLLGSCKVHGNVQVGLCAAVSALELDPENNSTILQLSTLYHQQDYT